MSKSRPLSEQYLRMPFCILHRADLSGDEKILLSHIWSFGTKGCWQSNDTLGEMFFASVRTISIRIKRLKAAGQLLWVNGKGYHRTLWAKSHPEVVAATQLPYRGQEVSKQALITGQVESTSPRKKLRKTKRTTQKETTEETAMPSPLPAQGQAPALLQDRQVYCRQEAQKLIAQIAEGFSVPASTYREWN